MDQALASAQREISCASNIQTLANDFLYRETQARAVSVDTRAIVETLKNVYGAERVVAEFTAK
jgi:hypothetical protein